MDRDTWEWIKEGFMMCKICDRWLDRHELMDVGVGHTICIECYDIIRAYVLNEEKKRQSEEEKWRVVKHEYIYTKQSDKHGI